MVIAERKVTAYLEDKLYADSSMNALVKVIVLSRMADSNKKADALLELAREEEVEFYPATVVYSLYDEESKVNINRTPSSVLKKIPGLDENKATAIRNSSLRPFFAKEQLLMLDEIELEDYLKMEDYLTVHGSGYININTAEDEILTALGFSQAFVDTFNEYRQGRDEKIGTDDDGFFQSISTVVDVLKEFGTVSLQDQQNVTVASSKNLLGVYSNNYLIKADVILRGKSRATYDVIFERNKGTIKRWQEK